MQPSIPLSMGSPSPAARLPLAILQASLCSISQVLNVIWFVKMTRGVLKALGGSKPKAA
jgi:hypothetical protein